MQYVHKIRIRFAVHGRVHGGPCDGRTIAACQSTFTSAPTHSDEELLVGRTYSLQKDFSGADVDDFAAMIGDRNPIHVDDGAAQRAGLKGRCIPGIMIAALFPSIIGSQCPGAIYASQQVTFRHPVMIGETLLAEVILRRRVKDWAIFRTTCKLQDGTLVADGEAKAKLPLKPSTLPSSFA